MLYGTDITGCGERQMAVPKLEKNHMVTLSSQDEALARYSV